MSARRGRRRLWVVKLGGSLAASPFLREWLHAIADGGGRVVVVAGGGPFADAVRAAQSAQTFDDATAHRMALLAMEQYAGMLVGLGRGLRIAASRSGLLDALRNGSVPVWLPARMVLANAGIEASWEVTSDSLAAWLAGALAASALILVKPVSLDRPCAADALARREVVDRAFPYYLARCGCECRIAGAAEYGAFRVALGEGTLPGMPVLSAQGKISR